MSEATAKVENEQEVNPIEDLVKASIAKDYNKAGAIFGEVMTVKLNDVLDQEKTRLAGQIYNGEEVPEEPELDIDGDEEDGADDEEDLQGAEDDGDSGDTDEEDEVEAGSEEQSDNDDELEVGDEELDGQEGEREE